ncbi:C4-dicarboxylate transporter DcuC [Pelosinus fermentans]|uniref:Anaerobic c4-dicarboxylate antiporter, DcuC family n=1 Tax=Pelosinus fermentans JBW45 TaxID=1192197 RepID=I8TRH2_9FIRM|nr:C4-dicarboxylate transporter DcuC [Pelosinus fermentans]AJQ25513.1 anaerobic c4-dicarboxylate antiporter, DcuC family [Pelosinus fermentans JBW45]
MLGLMIALFFLCICGYAIFKKYKAQTVLLTGGFAMMSVAILLGMGDILPAKNSTGSPWFDMFQFVAVLASKRAAEIGMLIMVVTGFARYMDKIGASRVLVHICIKPLQTLRSPYIVMALGFIIGQCLHLFIASASGLGVLLMVTMYPILISLGISRNGATAVIGTTSAIDLGPSSGNTVLAAKTAGLQTVDYFVTYQLPVAVVVILAIAVTHYFVQRWFDKKHEGGLAAGVPREEENTDPKSDAEPLRPMWYVFLPIFPMILILAFGFFKFRGIHLDIIPCMFVSLFISMVCEALTTRNVKKVFASIQTFFDGMGSQFATVITLIVAGETLAQGLTALGAIDTLINVTQSTGSGKTVMVLVMSGIIAVSCIVMGSGNAPFFAFSAFAPQVAKKLGFDAVNLLLPMQLTSSLARGISPITAVIVAVCGISGASPFEVVKRTAIPMAVGLLTTQIMTYILFG